MGNIQTYCASSNMGDSPQKRITSFLVTMSTEESRVSRRYACFWRTRYTKAPCGQCYGRLVVVCQQPAKSIGTPVQVKYPENFFLLRGNHECASINRIYGFYDECKRRYNVRLWKIFTDCFNCLPVAALVDEKVCTMKPW